MTRSVPLAEHPHALPALLTATLDSLSPLSQRRDLRQIFASLTRLQSALAQAHSADTQLFDAHAAADVRLALAELREIAARTRQTRARPRIRPERRVRDTTFATGERKRLEIVANRVDTLLQVALWKRRGVIDYAVVNAAGRPPRVRLGRRGRVFSHSEMRDDDRDTISIPGSATEDVQRPWHFSLIEAPITPLRSRSLHAIPDGTCVMAMWRSMRVSVKVIRKHNIFLAQAEYMYALGQSPSIPSLLGAHWEDAQAKKKDDVGDVGYLVMQVVHGTSLDKLVRDSKLTDTVSKICVLDRIVSALVFAQRIAPAATHQDLHPGNILLVPPTQPKEPALDPVHASRWSNSTDRSPVVSEAKIPDALDEVPPRAAARVHVHTAKPARINHRIQRPHIPKIEELTETLSVLDRVALHNKLDEAVEAEPTLRKNNKPRPAQPTRQLVHRPGVSPYTSSVTRTTASVGSTDEPERVVSPSVTGSSISSFTVMVMDFAPVHEAEGKRRHLSWNKNESLAGYCAPEKATSLMWQRIKQKMDKERERERERERRMIARSASNGRRSPRPAPRRRSSNGMGGFLSSRSSSSSHRRQFDAETYALFGDDNLVDFPEAGDNSFGLLVEPASPPDRSGRHAVARAPGALRELERPRDITKPRKQYSAERPHLVDEGSHKTSSAENLLGDTMLRPPTDETCVSKIDVWSVGWLLYYMCTGKHPPPDAWARPNALDERDLKDVPKECREVIKMCVQHDVQKRACVRDVKRHIDSILQGLMFAKGLALVETDSEAAFVLLDKAVGIKSSIVGRSEHSAAGSAFGVPAMADVNGDPGTTITNGDAKSLSEVGTHIGGVGNSSDNQGLGLNPQTRMGLASLPLVVVRRVEWEAAARYLERSKEEIGRLRAALVNEKWSKSDVVDGSSAIEYLRRRSEEGVSSAQSALGWVYRWGAGGMEKDVKKAMEEWEKAVKTGDPEACNGLGLVYHYGRDVDVDGGKALKYYQMAVDQGYPAAAVNLGVMLHDGSAGLPADGVAARGLYEMACRHGDAIAANNLGLLLQHGARGVQRDAAAAVRAYEMAIGRNERHHACRNLGELMWDGAEGVPRSRANAVEYFAQAIARGDTSSRVRAGARLRVLVREAQDDTEDVMPKALLERCRRLLSVR